jgi:chromosome segregation ATPase
LTQIVTLESSEASLQQQVSDLETERTTLQINLTKSENDNAELTSQIDALTININSLIIQITTVQTEKNDL